MACAVNDVRERTNRRMKGDYSEEDEKILAQWRSAKDFSALLDLKRPFLRGETEFSASHMGPLFGKTEALVPGLLRLHEYGLLSYSSQPFDEYGPFRYECPCCDEIAQRKVLQVPFLSFIIPQHDKIDKTALHCFLVNLKVTNDLYAFLTKPVPDNSSCPLSTYVVSSFPAGWATHYIKEAPKKKQLKNKDWQGRRHFDPGCTQILHAWDTDTAVLSKAGPLLVHVLARSSNEPDLLGIIEDAAIQAGMKPVYAQ